MNVKLDANDILLAGITVDVSGMWKWRVAVFLVRLAALFANITIELKEVQDGEAEDA